MRASIRHMAAAACLAIVAGASQAAVVNYQESLGGDLNGNQVFALGVGSNTVSGNMGFVPFGTSDSDNFFFVVGQDNELTSLTVSFTRTEGLLQTVDLNISKTLPLPGVPIIATLSAQVPGVTLFTTVGGAPLKLGSGTYSMLRNSLAGAGTTPGNFADYTFTFDVRSTVQSVPEPSTLALVGGLCLATAGAARRQRSS